MRTTLYLVLALLLSVGALVLTAALVPSCSVPVPAPVDDSPEAQRQRTIRGLRHVLERYDAGAHNLTPAEAKVARERLREMGPEP